MTRHVDMPELLQQVAAAADMRAVEELVEAFGGRRAYLRVQTLAAILSGGRPAAERIIAAVGAGMHDVPKWAARAVDQREQRAAELAAGGKTVREIAQALCVSERHARRMIRSPRPARNRMSIIKGPHTGMERRFVAEPTVEDYAELIDELHRARHGFGLDARQIERVREGWDNMPAHVQANAWREADLELLRHSRTAA